MRLFGLEITRAPKTRDIRAANPALEVLNAVRPDPRYEAAVARVSEAASRDPLVEELAAEMFDTRRRLRDLELAADFPDAPSVQKRVMELLSAFAEDDESLAAEERIEEAQNELRELLRYAQARELV